MRSESNLSPTMILMQIFLWMVFTAAVVQADTSVCTFKPLSYLGGDGFALIPGPNGLFFSTFHHASPAVINYLNFVNGSLIHQNIPLPPAGFQTNTGNNLHGIQIVQNRYYLYPVSINSTVGVWAGWGIGCFDVLQMTPCSLGDKGYTNMGPQLGSTSTSSMFYTAIYNLIPFGDNRYSVDQDNFLYCYDSIQLQACSGWTPYDLTSPGFPRINPTYYSQYSIDILPNSSRLYVMKNDGLGNTNVRCIDLSRNNFSCSGFSSNSTLDMTYNLGPYLYELHFRQVFSSNTWYVCTAGVSGPTGCVDAFTGTTIVDHNSTGTFNGVPRALYNLSQAVTSSPSPQPGFFGKYRVRNKTYFSGYSRNGVICWDDSTNDFCLNSTGQSFAHNSSYPGLLYSGGETRDYEVTFDPLSNCFFSMGDAGNPWNFDAEGNVPCQSKGIYSTLLVDDYLEVFLKAPPFVTSINVTANDLPFGNINNNSVTLVSQSPVFTSLTSSTDAFGFVYFVASISPPFCGNASFVYAACSNANNPIIGEATATIHFICSPTPSISPSFTPSRSISLSATITSSRTASPSISPTKTGSASVSASVPPSRSVSPSPTGSKTASRSHSSTQTSSSSPSPTSSMTLTPPFSQTASGTSSHSETATLSPSHSISISSSISVSPSASQSPQPTFSSSKTVSLSSSPTSTVSTSASATESVTGSATISSSISGSRSVSLSMSSSRTLLVSTSASRSPSRSFQDQSSSSKSASQSSTASRSPTADPTSSRTATRTSSSSPSRRASITASATNSPTSTESRSPTAVSTGTQTVIASGSQSKSHSSSRSPSRSASGSQTLSASASASTSISETASRSRSVSASPSVSPSVTSRSSESPVFSTSLSLSPSMTTMKTTISPSNRTLISITSSSTLHVPSSTSLQPGVPSLSRSTSPSPSVVLIVLRSLLVESSPSPIEVPIGPVNIFSSTSPSPSMTLRRETIEIPSSTRCPLLRSGRISICLLESSLSSACLINTTSVNSAEKVVTLIGNSGSEVGSITIPFGAIKGSGILRVTTNVSQSIITSQVISPVIDISLFAQNCGSLRLNGSIQICIHPNSGANIKTSCLGYLDESLTPPQWVCQDKYLFSDDDHGNFCGTTNHLTNFAILFYGGQTAYPSDFIFGNYQKDLALVGSVAGFIVVCCFCVLVLLILPCSRRLVYSKEALRVRATRLSKIKSDGNNIDF